MMASNGLQLRCRRGIASPRTVGCWCEKKGRDVEVIATIFCGLFYNLVNVIQTLHQITLHINFGLLNLRNSIILAGSSLRSAHSLLDGRFYCLYHFMQSSERTARNLRFLAGVSIAYLTLCSPRSGPRAIWDFSGSFYCLSHFITLCSPRSGRRAIWDFGGYLGCKWVVYMRFSSVYFILCTPTHFCTCLHITGHGDH